MLTGLASPLSFRRLAGWMPCQSKSVINVLAPHITSLPSVMDCLAANTVPLNPHPDPMESRASGAWVESMQDRFTPIRLELRSPLKLQFLSMLMRDSGCRTTIIFPQHRNPFPMDTLFSANTTLALVVERYCSTFNRRLRKRMIIFPCRSFILR